MIVDINFLKHLKNVQIIIFAWKGKKFTCATNGYIRLFLGAAFWDDSTMAECSKLRYARTSRCGHFAPSASSARFAPLKFVESGGNRSGGFFCNFCILYIQSN